MSDHDKAIERFNSLIAALRNGDLSEAEGVELRKLLKVVPGGYRRLSEHLTLTSLLESELKALPIPVPQEEKNSITSFIRAWRRILFPAIASIIFAGCLFLLIRKEQSNHLDVVRSHRDIIGEPLDHGVAVLTEALGADCDQNGISIPIGTSLQPGHFRLKSGVARIEFYSGASIVLDGSAELNILSANEARLISGRLLASVPPHARGFTIHSREVELVDQGTEFGISADENDGTRVYVLTGKVEIFEPNSKQSAKPKKEMNAGAGLHVNRDGIAANIPIDTDQFISPQELRSLISTNLQKRSAQWQEQKAEIQNHPKVIAYYPFERDPSNDRVLRNITRQAELLNGSIVGATWSDGRWPGKEALEFKRPGDRVRIAVPGQYPSMTVLAWVRIDGLDNAYNSLLLSDSWGRKGAMHWEFLNSGEMELSVCAGPGLDYDFRTGQKNLRAYDLGRWILLAAVYDADDKAVTHYVDGSVVQRVPMDQNIALEIGPAHIGNWSPAGYRDATPIRNFNGRMDELIIIGEALGPDAMVRFYQTGRPQT